MKNLFDFILSFFLLIIFLPLIIILAIAIFFTDFNNPFYISKRVGKNFKIFDMLKFRSMKVNADKNQVFSTKSDDDRITKIGKFLRQFKLDELPQLVNIFFGQMSFVGPRPNVKFEVDKYFDDEKKLLSIKPGITDFSSIIFCDEGNILKNSNDPNKDYNLLIRPWKSKLGLIYIKESNLILDFKIILWTLCNFINRNYVLNKISLFLKNKEYPENICEICLRKENFEKYI